MTLRLHVNGEDRVSRSDAMTPLVDVLRDEFNLTGAKPVCREGFCGACTVLLDEEPAKSHLLPCGFTEGRTIRTVEDLSSCGMFSDLQRAMVDHDAVRCGMCFPGMLMTLTSVLHHHPARSRDEIRAALSGNLCRCTGYERIVDAALSLAPAAVAR
ncbi:(2Fe-2S)-binding protein [Aureimonas pseudogalii]|uniref:Carbon-monoxide dehydrogenase small subunit n=1 Tax=Aureimonas pseudogalii TaxID=1744844 RepID=A0A7W6MKU7_9HYPH|nr:2Fe-2S iron-sulfur cluster-binding protein [Aureimonas pseudogalii]MBB3999239.1 carbon-monoxide dehydrogenase small subunit [Aureimonas pseudogalii]